MTSPIETKRNPWVLPGLILWAFVPTILMTSSMLGGWYADSYTIAMPGRSYLDTSPVGEAVLMVGVFGMPVILYPWGIAVLMRFSVKRFVIAALLAIPLTPVMCIVNLFLGFAGCTGLTEVIPKEGLF